MPGGLSAEPGNEVRLLLGLVYFNEMEFTAVDHKIKGSGGDHLQ